MAKNSITDYSKTAASNTDIQSVDIDEGCLPSGINNAIREVMADLADVNDGTVALTSPSATALDVTNNITVGGTVDGRDVATDGTKLDGIEAAADVTDTTNVTAAGAAMLTGATFTGSITATEATFSGNTSVKLPAGTEAQRPTGVNGMLRYNSDEDQFEGYADGEWGAIAGGGETSFLQYNYTATAGQTTFSGSDDNSATLAYVASNLIVTLNGIVLENGTDYTATSGTSIVLTDAAAVDDELNVVAFKSFTTADMVPASTGGTFTGNVSVTGDLTVDTDTLVVDSTNDRVGVGVSPARPLHVDAGSSVNTSARFDASGRDQSYIAFNDQNTTGELYVRMGSIGDNMVFNSGNSERMRIDSSGNVGIGNTSPESVSNYSILDVGSSSTQRGVINAYDGTVRASVWTTNSGVARLGSRSNHPVSLEVNGSEKMRIDSGGLVGIGTTAPETYFQAQGAAYNRGIIRGRASSSSYGSNLLDLRCNRANSSSYNMIIARSGNTNDNEFIVTGTGLTKADGGFQTGADYAEFFEWDDGNSSDEDRRGYSVVLTNGNKIRKATSSDAAADIIGVISGHPSVVGDAAWSSWGGKFNRDDFGAYILEAYTVTEWTETDANGDDVEHSYHTDQIPSGVTPPSDATVVSTEEDGTTLLTRKQVNPSYDDTHTYTPREDRQEWDAVGMVGKLRLRVGQPTGDRWIKMRDTATDDDGNVTVEEWLVR